MESHASVEDLGTRTDRQLQIKNSNQVDKTAAPGNPLKPSLLGNALAKSEASNIPVLKPTMRSRVTSGAAKGKQPTGLKSAQSLTSALGLPKTAAVTSQSAALSGKRASEKPPPQQEQKDDRIDKIVDIDLPDVGKENSCAEYAGDIYAYLFHVEKEFTVGADYLSTNPDCQITYKMRAVLIDWLVQVHSRFQLVPETLYLTIQILDRYLQTATGLATPKPKLQLVGVTAMLISCKVEEIQCPEVADFVYIADNTYSRNEVMTMERTILDALDFCLYKPIPLTFLRRFSKAANVKQNTHQLAKYLLELSFLDYGLVSRAGSQLAAAALYTSIQILTPHAAIAATTECGTEESFWGANIVHHCRYSASDLAETSAVLKQLLSRADKGPNSFIFNKFSSSKFSRIAQNSSVTSAAKRAAACS